MLWPVFKSKVKKEPIPKWRLRPDTRGTYFLDKWHPDVGMYLCERTEMTEESAAIAIENVDGRSTKYWRD